MNAENSASDSDDYKKNYKLMSKTYNISLKKDLSESKYSPKKSKLKEIPTSEINQQSFQFLDNISDIEETSKNHQELTINIENIDNQAIVKSGSRKKKFCYLFIILVIFAVFACVLSLTLTDDKTSKSKKISSGELYLMKCYSKSTVLSKKNGNETADQSVDSNSTYTIVVYNMTEENMFFMLIEGNFYFVYEEDNINIDLNVLDENNYLLVESDPKKGEINKIAYPNQLTSEKAEFYVPFIKAFIVNYQKIEEKDNLEDFGKDKMKKSIDQDEEFFYMKKSFESDKIKGKIIFDKESKLADFKDVQMENSIRQQVDKKDLKVKKSEIFLKVEFKLFAKSEFEIEISINNQIEAIIKEAPGKLNDEKLDSISDFIGKRRFQLLDESEENEEQKDSGDKNRRSLNDELLIIKEQVITDIFGNLLKLNIKIDKNPGNKYFDAFLILDNFFEYKVCQGMLPGAAIKNIQQIFELKSYFNSMSQNMLMNVQDYFTEMKSVNKLIINETSSISLINKNLSIKRKNYLIQIENFLENLSTGISFEGFSESILKEFISDHENVVSGIIQTSSKIVNISESIVDLEEKIEKESELLLNYSYTYNELPGILYYDLNQEELLKFNKFIKNKVEIESYLKLSSYEHDFVLEDIIIQTDYYKNNFKRYFSMLNERLLETCSSYNKYINQNFLEPINCTEIEELVNITEEASISNLDLAVSNLFNTRLDELIENTINTSSSHMENAFLTLSNLTDYMRFKDYSLFCNYTQVPRILMTVKVPAGYSVNVPIDIEFPTSWFNYFLVNETQTSVNASLESQLKIKGSAVLSTANYEIGAFYDAALILIMVYEIGFIFSTLELFNQGYQITRINRNTFLYYKQYIVNIVQECWNDLCGRKCRSVDKSYWTNKIYTIDQNQVNGTLLWNYLPQETFTLI